MSHAAPIPVIIGRDETAPAGALVVRRLAREHYRLEESGVELRLLADNLIAATMAVTNSFDSAGPKASVPGRAYACQTQSGARYEFSHRDSTLVIRPL
jgi:hypothetical protein